MSLCQCIVKLFLSEVRLGTIVQKKKNLFILSPCRSIQILQMTTDKDSYHLIVLPSIYFLNDIICFLFAS